MAEESKQRFVGRTEELKALNALYESQGFKMSVIYGRRRVGKTTLVNQFIDTVNCRFISFVCTEMNEEDLLKRMGDDVLDSIAPELEGRVKFESFDAIFDFIGRAADNERLVFVIDEYPYLSKACQYMNSLIQKYVDHCWKSTKLFLVLLGSMVSFMRDDVLGKDAPLHGRADLEFQLRPFDYIETAAFLPDYNFEDKAIVYGLTNGVAKYIEQFDGSLSLDENIRRLFFSRTAFFSEEQVKTIISGEKSNPAAYSAIITAIAGGKTRYNEIKTAANMSDISFCLNNLISTGIVERRKTPKAYYVIADSMVRFWFSYVNPGASLINLGRGAMYYDLKVKPLLHEYMGSVFEAMARHYVLKNSGTSVLPVFITDVFEYQNSIRTQDGTKNIELDILGKEGNDYALAGECKFRTEKFDKHDLDVFLEKLNYVPAHNLRIALFSLSGFTDYVVDFASEPSHNCQIIDIAGMFENKPVRQGP
ncbi:MAG TPA: hypothetical protein DCP98_07205 [Sphaerochaeta sp.]|nr:hypothetical protein [Sphaerochaeta sp.]